MYYNRRDNHYSTTSLNPVSNAHVCVCVFDIKILGVPPLGPGMPFLDRRGGGVGYLFVSGFSSVYDGIHGWMMR